MAIQIEVNGIAWDEERFNQGYPGMEGVLGWVNRHMDKIAILQGGMTALQELQPKCKISINAETIELITKPGFNIAVRLIPSVFPGGKASELSEAPK